MKKAVAGIPLSRLKNTHIVNIPKITPPRLPQIVNRPCLLERLRQNRDKKLILILGQAAQGKTTLAASFAAASSCPSAWINLSPEDTDAASLFLLLVRSLQRALKNDSLSYLLTFPALTMGPRDVRLLYRDWIAAIFDQVSQPVPGDC